MTSSVTKRSPHNGGDLVTVELTISSYTTGGESITPAILGLPTASTPYLVAAVRRGNAVAPLMAAHDTTNDKLILHDKDGEFGAAGAAVMELTFRLPVQ